MALVVIMPYFIDEIGKPTQLRGFSGTMALAAFIGSLASGVLADRIGRKPLMAFASVIFLVGSLFQTGGDNAALVFCGRAVTGVCVGIYSMLVPLYQSEIAPKHLRGRLITIHQYAITLGIFCASWVVYGTIKIQNGSSWRLAMGLQMIPCLILLILIQLIPESPRYLMSCDYDTEALHVLAKIHGEGSIDHPDVCMEYVTILQSIEYERTFKNHGSYTRLFSKAPENNWKRLLLGILTQSFQQLTGINAILLYAPQILHSAGLSGVYPSIFANCISSTVNMLATIPAVFLIDRFGRRSSMVVGAFILCICLVIMAVLSLTAHFIYGGDYSSEAEPAPTNDSGVFDQFRFRGVAKKESIAFISIQYLYLAVFAYTWGPLGWIYPSELYGQDVRAKALSITSGFSWLLNFAVSEFSTPMLLTIHGRSYIVFACCCAFIVFFVYFFFPETKGKSLEEIDLIFGSDIGYFEVNGHHHQTAAATLIHMERMQKKNASKYPFHLGKSGPILSSSNTIPETRSLAPCEDDGDILHPTSLLLQSSTRPSISTSLSSGSAISSRQQQQIQSLTSTEIKGKQPILST
ncbi:unnamed protein product [Absidia cylindrospora]